MRVCGLHFLCFFFTFFWPALSSPYSSALQCSPSFIVGESAGGAFSDNRWVRDGYYCAACLEKGDKSDRSVAVCTLWRFTIVRVNHWRGVWKLVFRVYYKFKWLICMISICNQTAVFRWLVIIGLYKWRRGGLKSVAFVWLAFFLQIERYDDFIVLFSGVLRNNAFSAILKSKALP